MTQVYSRRFFEEQQGTSASSASRAVAELLKWISPASVVDVGCGVGTWLAEFERQGVHDILGMDGDYVKREMLVIDPACFEARDLGEPIEAPRTFDLAVSLEVGEHLAERRAEGFVADLCRLAPLVLFSAAVPGQGGTHHVNEQWQSYWADRFRGRGFEPIDVLRGALWDSPDVEFWYAQNTILYASSRGMEAHAGLAGFRRCEAVPLLDVVHPRLFAAASRVDALGSAKRRVKNWLGRD